MGFMVGRTDTSGRYRFLDLVGEGGFGAIYRADDTKTRNPVAVKILHQDLVQDERDCARFEREQQVMIALSHPFIVKGLATAEVKDGEMIRPAVVIEYVEGKDLFDILRDERILPQDEIARIVIQLGLGLDYLHHRGIVHRDLKPENVMKRGYRKNGGYPCYPRGEVCIFDFGCAGYIQDNAVYERKERSKSEQRRTLFYKERQLTGKSITAPGAVFGTPEYSSPEQARGDRDLDGRSDLYSLGIIMYRAMTGAWPFRGGNKVAILKRQISEAPRPLDSYEVCRKKDLDGVCMRLLEKDPDKRYQTGRDLVYAVLDALPASEADRIMLEMTVGLLGVDWNYEHREKPAPEPEQPVPEIYTTKVTTASPTNGKIQEPVEMPPEEPRKPSYIGDVLSFFLAPHKWINWNPQGITKI